MMIPYNPSRPHSPFTLPSATPGHYVRVVRLDGPHVERLSAAEIQVLSGFAAQPMRTFCLTYKRTVPPTQYAVTVMPERNHALPMVREGQPLAPPPPPPGLLPMTPLNSPVKPRHDDQAPPGPSKPA